MMNSIKLMNKLVKLGLTESAAKIYLLLLQKSISTASELSKHSGISRSKTYELLDTLVKKGLCSELLGGVKKYVPVNPRKSLLSIQKQLKAEYDDHLTNVDELLNNLYPLYESEKSNFDNLDFIQVFRSKVSSLEKAEYFEERAQGYILSLCKPPYAMGLQRDYNKKRPYINRLREDIKYRSIYEYEENNQEEFFQRVSLFQQHGGEARISLNLPLKLVIFGKEIVILNLANQAGKNFNFTTLSIEHASVAELLTRVFEIYWEESIPFENFHKDILKQIKS
ncbi:MAG: helix-turn-helix domain-containing protein [Candidatus Cloacimonetes bacterium]|nr:helix-turn-helix domain-containing protein [Candidatus Cloacimonadota bacterium]